MQRFRTEMRIAPQRLPILMAGHQRNLLDLETRLEQAARSLVAGVMEMQIDYAEILAYASERRAGGTMVERENALSSIRT